MTDKTEHEQLEMLMTRLLQSLARYIGSYTPDGWGFVLVLTEHNVPDATGKDTNVLYVSDIQREGALETIENWIAEMRAGKVHLPDPADMKGGSA